MIFRSTLNRLAYLRDERRYADYTKQTRMWSPMIRYTRQS